MSLSESQHLSDEAVAAFADGALSGQAAQRARRHSAGCAECAYAVAVQREATWALRAAPAPGLPAGLLDRLREVPSSTPLRLPPTVLGSDGTTLLSTSGGSGPADAGERADHGGPAEMRVRPQRSRRMRPVLGIAMGLAAAGAVSVGVSALAGGGPASPTPVPARVGVPAHVQPAVYAPAGGEARGPVPLHR